MLADLPEGVVSGEQGQQPPLGDGERRRPDGDGTDMVELGAKLVRLRLPHQRGSAAVSLVERQVLVLREKNTHLEQRLHELIENGRTNDLTTERVHKLTRRLLRTRDLAGVLGALETSLREDFGASRWVLLAVDPATAPLAGLQNAHLRVVPRGSPELRIFESFFESARPRSGQIRDTQRDYLFGGGAEGSQVGSTVLIPLDVMSSPLTMK